MYEFIGFLNRLRAQGIAFTVEHNRDDAVMVLAVVPGERWEIEFFADGHTEVEVFTSGGVDDGAGKIEALFDRFGGRAR
ncbi:MAG: hypothetical protein AAGG50_17390 [Bacteroidota bacterium]